MQEARMNNFDLNINDIVYSSLTVKASGSIIAEAQSDLSLPDGADITQLLQNEKNIPKK